MGANVNSRKGNNPEKKLRSKIFTKCKRLVSLTITAKK